MKLPRIANAVGQIDEELIAAAAESKRQSKGASWLKWGSVAACFAAIVIAGVTVMPMLLGSNGLTENSSLPENSSETDDRYKDFFVSEGESAFVWPWEYLTVFEKYTELQIDGIRYQGKRRAVSDDRVEELIGTFSLNGYDWITDEKHTEAFEVYKLKYVHDGQLVAVKMDGAYYVFGKSQYAPPKTLGELFAAVELPQAIELKRFSQNGDSAGNHYFTLPEDDFIWEVLAGCKDAKFVKDDKWTAHTGEFLSFTVTSETLGVYKVAMYVTKDGYLWTNAFDYGYLFFIGEDAAGRIFQYAMKHSEKAEYEPYRNAIVGQITEITEGYLLVDDSLLCKDPKDGITYKVLLSDPAFSRYVDSGFLRVGKTVQISYEGYIDKADGYTVSGAISAEDVILSEGEVMIPE